jgi:hypothetical protein
MSKETFGLVWGILTVIYLIIFFTGKIQIGRAQNHLSHNFMTFFLFVTITGLILNAFVE